MKVQFSLNDGNVINVDTERHIIVDDELFEALMNVIEIKTGNCSDMDKVTEVKIEL